MHEEASYWSAARIDLLKNKAAIGKASKHYNRKDKSALQRRRPGASGWLISSPTTSDRATSAS
jgi:hypothetical protein